MRYHTGLSLGDALFPVKVLSIVPGTTVGKVSASESVQISVTLGPFPVLEVLARISA